ncbi:MAG TPA: hypothetical protein VGI75_09785 [Pirellulales bacterium]
MGWHRLVAPRALTVAGAIVMGYAISIPVAGADDFRIESKVFAGAETSASSESLTLFSGNRAYDFISAPHEITIFDFSRDEIVLLDATRKVRTELTTEKLNSFSDQLRTRAARQTDPLLKFAAHPRFEESHDDDGWLQFSSPSLTYRVQAAKIENPAVVREYRQFCDASAQLNSMLHPGAMPPFPRLTVNTSLEHANQLPEQVEVTITAENQPAGKPTVLRSQHQLTMHLLADDQKRIDEANADLTAFKAISWEEYLRPIQQAKR